MEKKTVIIEGGNFIDLDSFFTEIDRVLTKDLNWETGHNFAAYNDLLRGGFGVYEYEEPVIIIWTNFSNSLLTLGKELTTELVDIIKTHQHIEFQIKD